MTVFDDAAADFVRVTPALWGPLGAELVAAAAPEPGERVLDVCCGAGASALPAAQRVGPTGAVDAIDVAARLLDEGRAAAGDELPWLRFVHADATTWTGDAPYDVVQCGFGVFFLPDMDADTRRLARLLRPGGRLAVMTWRHGALAGYARTLHAAVEHVRGEPLTRPSTADASARVDAPATLTAWLTSLGLVDAVAVEVAHRVPLDDGFVWDLVIGSGFRRLLADLDADAVAAVRAELPRRLAAESIRELDAGALIGLARAPQP